MPNLIVRAACRLVLCVLLLTGCSSVRQHREPYKLNLSERVNRITRIAFGENWTLDSWFREVAFIIEDELNKWEKSNEERF